MLVTVKFIKGWPLFYKIKSKRVGDNIIIYALKPKTKHSKAKLKNALLPYEGKIIYPKDFSVEGFPKGFDVKTAQKIKKLKNFLKKCKAKRPKTAVIISNGQIAPGFYKDISPFVGKIVLPNTPVNMALKNELLTFSGTPIVFGGEVPKSDDETLILFF